MNVGILGFGAMGKTHAYSIQNLPYFYDKLPFKANVYGVYTRTHATSIAASEQFNFKIAAKSDDELINHPDIDIIDICTPNNSHYETLKKAINAGKHVYCEKPLCISEAQAYEIAELADKKGIVGQIVFNNRFISPILRAKELILEGKLGNIVSFRCAYLHSSCTDLEKNAGWKQNKDICGGGVLFDLGSHAIDLVYFLCGEFDSITGKSQIAHKNRKGMNGEMWKTNADEAFYIIAELKNGAFGTIEANKIALGTNDNFTLEIYGDKGSIKFDLMEPNWLHFYDGTAKGGDLGGERGFNKIECVGRYPSPAGVFPGVKAPIGWLRGHIGSMYNFFDCVYRNAKTSPSFKDAAYVQHLMESAYQSDEKKETVYV